MTTTLTEFENTVSAEASAKNSHLLKVIQQIQQRNRTSRNKNNVNQTNEQVYQQTKHSWKDN